MLHDWFVDVWTGKGRHVDVVMNHGSRPTAEKGPSEGNIGIGVYRYMRNLGKSGLGKSGRKSVDPTTMQLPTALSIENVKNFFCISRLWLTVEEAKALYDKLPEVIQWVEDHREKDEESEVD